MAIKIEVENGWVTHNTSLQKLQKAGYTVTGIHQTNKMGESRYVYALGNFNEGTILYESEDIDAVNRFASLLVEA
jgi:hypothetical protein